MHPKRPILEMSDMTLVADADQRPRYMQVADDLRAAISSGRYGPGAQLPTENDLCEVYQVSRFTVREALRTLQEDGLISRKRGSGTIVEADGGPRRLRQKLGSVSDILQYAADTTFDFRHVGMAVADDRLSRLLGCDTGSEWIEFSGLRRAPIFDRVMCHTEVYLHRRFTDSAELLRQTGDTIFRQLEVHYGIRIARVAQDIQAVPAGKPEAKALKVDLHSPCLRIVRTYWDSQGDAVEYSVNTHPGDLFTYSMLIEADRD
jgi:GntR family transcriptional regulator